MRKLLKYLSRLFFLVALVIVLYLVFIILVGVFTDYHPAEVTELEVSGKQENTEILDSTLTFLTWNIGYAGLGAEMDFFYDGGKMVRPTRNQIEKYTVGILDYLELTDSIDFILLQEVDRESSRTKFQDELSMALGILTGHSSSFGYNYKVQFVPVPLTNPLGKVEMGQATFSEYFPISSQRYSYYSAYAWPKRLFMLDRCFLVSRFHLPNGKELVVINTHNSAYDSGGKLRDIEMPLIRNFMLNEFEKGNYVVAGGDWNQNPPDYQPETIETVYPAVRREALEKTLFPEDWKISYEPQKPTNRGVENPLTPGKTEVTIIDYFILSPNIELENVKVDFQNFQYSDHEPVLMNATLK